MDNGRTSLSWLLVAILVIGAVQLPVTNGSVDTWAIKIPGGMDQANKVAEERGCSNTGPLRGFEDVYLFKKSLDDNGNASKPLDERHLVHRTKRQLESHPFVAWVDPQMPVEREKRDLVLVRRVHPLASSPRAIPLVRPPPVSNSVDDWNDELWSHQWYLQDNTNAAHIGSGIGHRVEDVWRMGFFGKGVVVSVLDDGLEWNHTDLRPNYDPRASYDLNNDRADPFPRYNHGSEENNHGTRCAGIIAMTANNRKCGVGVAPQAKIGGIKCIDGLPNSTIEALSMQHNLDHIDIYSVSWGPKDNGIELGEVGRLVSTALENGIKYGRQGKGAIYVWANGNGGINGDHCNCDGFITSIYTIAIGPATQLGQFPTYGERCSSTMAVTCSSGAVTERKVVTTDIHNQCTIEYQGTSASAPLAAGIFALVLEANKNLTWRDVQHITAWTSNPIPLRDNPGWKRNAAGLLFNNRFGFGLLNAQAAVEAALKWQTVPRASSCLVAPSTRLPAFLQSRNMVQVVFVSDGCQSVYERQRAAARANAAVHQPETSPVIYLEHVEVIVDIEYSSRGNLDIFLISPSGTVSAMLNRRPYDNMRDGFNNWSFMSVHFWGETSMGKWTLLVRDKNGHGQRGRLRGATLKLHGTSQLPAHQLKGPRVYEDEQQVQSFLDPVLELDEEDVYDLNNFPNEMTLVKDDSYPPTMIKSLIAQELAHQHQ